MIKYHLCKFVNNGFGKKDKWIVMNKEVKEMTKTIGKVIEVYIPEQYKNGGLLDVMDRTNIGFKVMTDDGIKDIVLEANELNSKIMKNDLVLIIEQDISGNHFIDIEAYEGDSYE